jgi:hypothetical protein
MLAGGVLIVIGGGSDETTPTTTTQLGGPVSESGRVQEDPLALGLGRHAGGSSAATNVAGGSALDTVGLPDVDPCSLVGDASVDAAIGPNWQAEPSWATGNLQCRWTSSSPGAEGGEIHLTVGRAALYERIDLPGARPLSGLGREAVGSTSASGGFIAVLSEAGTLVVAVSSGGKAAGVDVTGLVREALGELPPDRGRGNG